MYICIFDTFHVLRLLRHDPKLNETEVLISSLRFANGVQLSEDEEFVLVSESARSRVMKLVCFYF